MEKFCDFLETIVERIGHIAMWSNALLVLIIILQVTLRYVFNHGLVALEELEWHLYAVGIMTGASYAMVKDVHIRVDLVYLKFSNKTKAVSELFGILFLLLPFLWVIFHQSLDFVHEAWRLNEGSPSPMGLPYRWVIKSFIPFGFGLMILVAMSKMTKLFISLWRPGHGTE
ncbi:MAG: TRAP transporter small permease subunit [Desulfobacula sp.]|uniref:TRAP transporter small permease subunit n=1 Tax=Desulfobacula sp. TaxID=2593537 RepID=UPI0025B91F74|nr:TRAP transporter small permease subunit [Desulfobacula sp.]MCD4719713.1 TRAP transporter small permease subunit [Desulfobacula sp.]